MKKPANSDVCGFLVEFYSYSVGNEGFEPPTLSV